MDITTSKLVGYTVNIWNPLNFQIHLDLPENLDLYYDLYEYLENEEKKIGRVYRCRLRNLRMKNENDQEIMNEIQNRINKSNGWVIVKINYVDKYKRLIVDLFDPITLENYYDILTYPGSQIEKY